MYTCPNCYKLTRDKPEFCLRCGFDTNVDYYKPEETSNNETRNTEQLEFERLNEIIENLRQKGKQALASRDEWKSRAELAERKQKETHLQNDIKFRKVKKMFSKMYHPDSLTGDRFEKLVKQEIFKEFWQIIEDIEKTTHTPPIE